MSKYIDNEPVGTSNGFWYDLTDGGYIRPEELLTDKKRVAELRAAITLLEEWKTELEDDEMLREL